MGAGASRGLNRNDRRSFPIRCAQPSVANPLSSTEMQWRTTTPVPPPQCHSLPPLVPVAPPTDLHEMGSCDVVNPRQHLFNKESQRCSDRSATATCEAQTASCTPLPVAQVRPQSKGSSAHAVERTGCVHDQILGSTSPPPADPLTPTRDLRPAVLNSERDDISSLPSERCEQHKGSAAANPVAIRTAHYRPIARSASPPATLGEYNCVPLRHVQTQLKERHKVFRICLTGGPCAGKSTFLSYMQTKMTARTGFQVLCVPEAATLLMTGGLEWDGSLVVQQQLCLLRTQLTLEDQFFALAIASGKPTIVVSDRGTMDGRAFCTHEQFDEILRYLGCSLESLRDRYDGVIHLVTSALGAEEFYSLDNPARYEDLDGARASDEKLRHAYIGHPMLRIIDNSTSFEEKMERSLSFVSDVVGQTIPLQNTVFYLVRQFPSTVPIHSAAYEVTITVLCNSTMDEIRTLVKRKGTSGACMYFFTSVRRSRECSSLERSSRGRQGSNASCEHVRGNGQSFGGHGLIQCVESQQRISSKEFASLLMHRDPLREDVTCEATHFLFHNANFEVMTIRSPSWAAGKQTMTVEYEDVNNVPFPPFVKIDREVPTEKFTTAFLISHRETGPLYTSLVLAPVFSRNIAALGPHADVEDMQNSVMSTPLMAAPSCRTDSRGNTPHRALYSTRTHSKSNLTPGENVEASGLPLGARPVNMNVEGNRKEAGDEDAASHSCTTHVPRTPNRLDPSQAMDSENNHSTQQKHKERTPQRVKEKGSARPFKRKQDGFSVDKENAHPLR